MQTENHKNDRGFNKLKTAIIEGMESGVSSRNVLQIMEDVKKQLKDEGRV